VANRVSEDKGLPDRLKEKAFKPRIRKPSSEIGFC
jgi:hypothetical protein